MLQPTAQDAAICREVIDDTREVIDDTRDVVDDTCEETDDTCEVVDDTREVVDELTSFFGFLSDDLAHGSYRERH